MDHGAADRPARTVQRVQTDRGELVPREAAGRYEIISNGVFLMDTSAGDSERLLVDAAVARCAAVAPRLLIGGLGVGFRCARRPDTRTSRRSTWWRSSPR